MKKTGAKAGFTLVEVLVVLIIFTLLATGGIVAAIEMTRRKAIEREDDNLSVLATYAKNSFQSSDFNSNLSSFSAQIGPFDAATVFDTSSLPTRASITGNEWFCKVGRIMGELPVVGAAVSETSNKPLYDICTNMYLRSRLLVAGPTNETNAQRYMIISLMAPVTRRLPIPDNDGTAAWFNEIWNNNWELDNADIPAGWLSRLTAGEVTLWRSNGSNKTNVSRLRVKRFIQPKFKLVINNSHVTEYGWADYNGSSSVLTSNPNSGPTTGQYILGGRRIVIRRGAASPGSQAYDFNINENTTITIQ